MDQITLIEVITIGLVIAFVLRWAYSDSEEQNYDKWEAFIDDKKDTDF